MVSLDQVLLLEQKVESAVAKIAQLQAENDALRSKCSELTNALSSKSEQLSSFESDQNKIESGILKALDRLNSIENSVLRAAGQVPPSTNAAPAANPQPVPQRTAPQTQPAPQVSYQTTQNSAPIQNSVPQSNNTAQSYAQVSQPVSEQPGFFDLNQTESQPEMDSDNTPEDGDFDIF